MKYNTENVQCFNTEYVTILEYINSKKVRCRCEYCKEEFYSALSHIREGCVHRKCYANIKTIHPKLTLDEINQRHNEYSIAIEYNGIKDVVCKCLLCGEIYHTTLAAFSRGSAHRKCYTKTLYEKYCDKYMDKTTELQNTNFEYTSVLKYYNATKVECQCKICGELYTTAYSTLIHGGVHRPCYGKIASKTRLQQHDEVIRRIEYMNPSLRVIGQYIGANDNIEVQCRKCGHIFNINAYNGYTRLHLCPKCDTMSCGEVTIDNFLQEHNIEHYAQYSFKDCVYIHILRFDFYIPQYNLCIEYQGKQHYEPIDFSSKLSDEEKLQQFKDNQTRDNIKREYCKLNNINLLEISYMQYDNINEILTEYFKTCRDCDI